MRSSFFITSGENQILNILQCLGLAFFVQLVEVVQQGSLGGGENGRNIYDAKELGELGFTYECIGK